MAIPSPVSKKRLQPATCLMMGLIGTVFSAAAGLLTAFSPGPAMLLRMVSFVMEGAMLLFLALALQGADNKKNRLGLLGLFFMLLVSYFNLPLLCPALEMLVLPLFALWQRKPGDGPVLVVLGAAELGYAVCRTLILLSAFHAVAPRMEGLALAVVSAARFWLLFRLHRRAGKAAA